MYTGNTAPWEQYPKQLRFSEVVNPLQVLVDFFNSGKPKSHRRDLKLWRYYVTKDKGYKDRHGAGHILFIHDGNVGLMEAMHLLLVRNDDRWPKLEDVNEEQLSKEKETWAYFPKNLSPEELTNPYRAVRKCFRKIIPQQYRDFLHEWLQAALYNSAADETNTPAEIIDVYGNIRRLYSAAWLIHQRETSHTYLRSLLKQDNVDTAIPGGQVTVEQENDKPEANEDENDGDEPDEEGQDAAEHDQPKHIEIDREDREQKENKQQKNDAVNPDGLSPIKDVLPELSEAEESKLEKVRNHIISRISSVRLIFLLGTHHSPFTFYLVILIDDKEKTPEHEIANKIEDNCRHLTSVFAIVHKLTSAKEALENGRRFWNYMRYKSICVYQYPDTKFPGHTVIEDQFWLQKAQQDWDRWGVQGKAFFKGAAYYLNEGEYGLAVFSLHQAAESSLIAIIKAVLGYRLSVHNLARMVRITLLFTEEIKKVLLLDTTEGVQLFTLLQNAYSEARYKSGYQPDEQSVRSLKVKVEVLLAVIGNVYRQFVKSKKDIY